MGTILFPNGDEEALVRSLERVALRRVFPTHRIADEVVRRVSEAHSLGRHVRLLRQICAEVAAAPSAAKEPNSAR
jgi:hypothetical protein